MNNLSTLIRLEIKRNLATLTKKNKAFSIFIYILMLFSSLSLGIFVPMFTLGYAVGLEDSTAPSASLDISTEIFYAAGDLHLLSILIIAILFGFFMGKNTFFNSFDQDTLWALPVEKMEIFLSKYIGFVLTMILPTFLYTIPTLVCVYFGKSHIAPIFFHLFLTTAGGLGGLAFGMFIRLLFIFLLSKFHLSRWGVSLIRMLFMLVFFVVYFQQAFSGFQGVGDFYLNHVHSIPIFQLASKTFTGSYIYLLFFFLFAVIFMGLLFFLLKEKYHILNEKSASQKKAKKVNTKDLRVQKPFVALVKKEISLYWSNSAIVANTFISVFFMLILAALTFVPSLKNFALEEMTFGYLTKDTLVFFAMFFLVGTANISCFQFSLESRMAYNTYVLPLSGQKIFLAKLTSGLVQVFPVFLLSFVLVMISLKPSPSYLPLIFFGPLFYMIFNNGLGLFFDLTFANYTWDDPKQLAKQSKQAFFTGFGNLILSAIILLIGYQMIQFFPYLFCLLVTLLMLVADIVLLLLVKDTTIYHN
ncbi:hypothetical protein LQU94_00660 [Peptoniphilus sp. KCTC 25270]|uniref:hypothetical protein n=1 Tax=Peptoniphilus sp. KCTC 25270 TaxID=2897414 RepID=UPI001E5FC27B|nr:hypothetical protein [Peptoniphilus sp. KCTC 25270]MCD1146626.1 hypothetical protein [Peptoniphilus sp. KCTC 25270]